MGMPEAPGHGVRGLMFPCRETPNNKGKRPHVSLCVFLPQTAALAFRAAWDPSSVALLVLHTVLAALEA